MKIKNINKKSAALVFVDFVIVNAVYLFSAFLYENFSPNARLLLSLLLRVPYVSLFYLGIYGLFKLYKTVWKYAGLYEALRTAFATVFGTLCVLLSDFVFMMISDFLHLKKFRIDLLDWPVYIDSTLLIIAAYLIIRLSHRSVRMFSSESKRKAAGRNIMVIGAGSTGNALVHELQKSEYRFGNPVVMVDDDLKKVGGTIGGTPIIAGTDNITEIAKIYDIDEIIFCIPTLEEKRKRVLLEKAIETGCVVKLMPNVDTLPNRTAASLNYTAARKVDIADLLSRSEIELDPDTCRYVTGETVLVTGGGGSIGSELCRQLAKYQPKKIVIFDMYENNAYMLKCALEREYLGDPQIEIRIGSVQDTARLHEIFEEFHPSSVFHAAAHKHVPLMEDSPYEAIKNNVLGTYNMAECAVGYGAKRFVLLSTDKAVNPANVMGATKRTAELIVQHFARVSKGTIFAAVRFGNVLGSNGSVIPLFKSELENGGPLTVTHPEITRYFMTIPEAAQLVVQAGGLAKGGEIFVLDMGEPVKILTLAEKLIKLSGFEPYVDIDIRFTGLRPGEKLYEELVLPSEKDGIRKTQNDKIFITLPVDFSDGDLLAHIHKIADLKPEDSRAFLMELVPTFSPRA